MDTTTNYGRTLVLCFDGTASQFDGDNTNVVKLFSLLKKDEPGKQLVYYQPGVGTFAKPGVLTPVVLWCAKMVDMAVACYLDEHVLGGYMFLMQNYQPGDRIVMFGFSRGAYTARSLAGMLHKVGLLPRDNLHHAPFAYKMYRRNDATGFEQSRYFKQTFSRSVEIDFMGLWDTVSSVGVIHARTLPFTSSNATVRTFRHALSLDEHRSRFRPTLWEHSRPSADHPAPSCKQKRRGTQSAPPTTTNSPAPAMAPSLHIIAESEGARTAGPASIATGGRSPAPPPHVELPGAELDDHVGLHTPVRSPPGVIPLPETGDSTLDPEKAVQEHDHPDKEAPKNKFKFKIPYWHQWRKQRKVRELERLLAFEREFDKSDSTDAERWRAHAGSPSPRMGRKTDVLEVWFAGGHSDVGGGNDLDSEPHMLSNVPFHWMVREAIHAQVGLLFDRAGLARHNLHLDAFMLSPLASRHRIDSGIAGLGISLSAPVTPFMGLSRAVSRESDGASADHTALSQAFRPPRGPTSSSLQLNVYGPDVLCPARDELKDHPLWWALELLPSPYWFQNGKGKWKRTSRPNMGRARIIPERDPHVHWSVRTRMDHEELAYRPRAQWQGDPVWVF